MNPTAQRYSCDPSEHSMWERESVVVGSRFVRGAYVIVTWRDGDDKGINTPWVAFISRVQASR